VSTVNINVHEVTRVEGHGTIVVSAKDGRVEEARFDIIEGPRFFESMLRGRSWMDVNYITSRICGICAVGHCTTSVKATEDAMKAPITRQTMLLRKLNFYAEQLQSHFLHAYFLVAPDALGVGSVIPLATSHPDIVKRALRLKKFGNSLSDLCCGRHVMPQAMVPGGFTRIPTKGEVSAMLKTLESLDPDVDATVELFSTIKWPEFERETEYVSLTSDTEYAFYDGDIMSSDGWRVKPQDYRKVINEKVVAHSTAKHTWSKRSSLMVGALARFNNNSGKLHPRAKAAAEALRLKAKCVNPFMNTAAQVVEAVHCHEESRVILQTLLDEGLKRDETPKVVAKAGRGVGATEVPRGLLIHEYTYDPLGQITESNLIIPTNQNLANIEDDMRAFVPKIMNHDKEEVRLLLEMLVRAYDPCISCSVHMLNLKFV
jgi:sulfhydrogenase subunit alpha